MSDVIILTDSDESALPVGKRDKNGPEIARLCDSNVAVDFDFPEVPFYYDTAENSASQIEKDSNTNLNIVNGFKLNAHRLSYSRSDSCDSADDQSGSQTRVVSKQKKKKKQTILKEERLLRQQALARDKTLKAIALKRSNDTKPGECLKFMEVNLDRGIDAFSFRAEVKDVLRNADIKFNITDALIPNSITWRRNVEESYIGEDDQVCIRRNVQAEEYVIVIWSNREAVTHVAEGTFCASVLDIKALMLNHNVVLVIFGIEEYFAYRKKQKLNGGSGNKGARRVQKSRAADHQQLDALPIVSRQQLEECLTKVQMVAKCSNRLIENAQDLGLMVYQYTKSISEIPYKLQKSESQRGKFDWYVMADNKDTVHVNKNGNGLKRLWQQQLCQFNLSSLETAEAICTIYPSPAQLIEAYRNCTPDKAANLLKDIPIRRAAGPLTAVRKIGPELSKKVYMMFTSQNGDTLLGTEK